MKNIVSLECITQRPIVNHITIK